MALVKVIFILSLAASVSSKVFYVDQENGKEGNSGDSIESPFTTIQECIDAVENPGDECRIREGIQSFSSMHYAR